MSAIISQRYSPGCAVGSNTANGITRYTITTNNVMSDEPTVEIVQNKQMYRDTNNATPIIMQNARVPANTICHFIVAIMNYC